MIIIEGREKNNQLRGAIVKTVAFFDMFDWPLTVLEIWHLLPFRCEYDDVLSQIDSIIQLENKQDMYFLTGQDDLLSVRRDRYSYFLNKLERAKKVAWLFSFVPWVKLIAIGNVLGEGNTKRDGDIDFFILAQKNRLYLSRFFCTGLAKVLGLRPTKQNKQDKICLSFYVSEEALNLESLQIEFNTIHKHLNKDKYFDIYFLYWLAELFVLYDADDYYERLIDSNSWLKEYLPNWQAQNLNHANRVKRKNSQFYQDIWEMLFSGLEKTAQKIERKIMPDDLIRLIGKGTGVVINNQVIKMFKNDRRKQVFERWRKQVDALLKNSKLQMPNSK